MRKTLTVGIILLLFSVNYSIAFSDISYMQGQMSGELTSRSVILQSRLTESSLDEEGDLKGMHGFARFEVSKSREFSESFMSDWIEAKPESDFIIKKAFYDLEPGTKYYYRILYGGNKDNSRAGRICTFETNVGEAVENSTNFVVVTGMHYSRFHRGPKAYYGKDKKLGYPALESILKLKPDFFVGTGDNVYYDHDPVAKTESQLRKKWHEQFVQQRYVELFCSVPTYWEKDDHDHRYDDSDTTDIKQAEPSNELGIRMFREQVPVVDPQKEELPTYRTHRISKLLQIWFLEGRDYRTANIMADGPKKTIWGQEQRKWLMKTLMESDAEFKIIISPTPMVGPDDKRKRDNHTNIGGFRYEGTKFFEWCRHNGFLEKGLYFICGDRHWQYHSIHPSGFEEFSTGALVDGNSRMGVNPGDINGTDPDALIVQPYTTAEPTGGFLNVIVNPSNGESPASIEFRFYDENGKLLYKNMKISKALKL
ncbi:MAG TPA: alkaline phosphatase D family protein [bacterium]|nr:alkaline phosphatase D family protein [bacterium]